MSLEAGQGERAMKKGMRIMHTSSERPLWGHQQSLSPRGHQQNSVDQHVQQPLVRDFSTKPRYGETTDSLSHAVKAQLSPRQQHKLYKHRPRPPNSELYMTLRDTRPRSRNPINVRDVSEESNRQYENSNEEHSKYRPLPRVKHNAEIKGQGHWGGKNSKNDTSHLSFTQGVLPRNARSPWTTQRRSLDSLDTVHSMDTNRFSHVKPKMAKSVHFAPDVKYICRESRNKPVKRTHSTNGRVSVSGRSGERDELPAVVEKYMIRALPVIPDITSTQDATDLIDNMLNSPRNESNMSHQTDINSNSLKLRDSVLHNSLDGSTYFNRSPSMQRRQHGLVIHTQDVSVGSTTDTYLPRITKSHNGISTSKQYSNLAGSVDISDRLRLRHAVPDKSLPSLTASNQTTDPNQATSTRITSAALSRDNHKPARMVFTVHTNVHDKKRAPRSPRPGLKYGTKSGYSVSFCAL